MEMFDHVAEYQTLGWHLFPVHWVQDGVCSCGDPSCTNIGKHPLTPHGVWDATNELKVLYRWWRKYPLANIAVHCGVSGFLVLDLDTYKDVYLANAVEKLLTPEDENTVTGLSGGGGGHLYFWTDKHYGNHRQHVPAGIDIRARGGYVILPPSNHKSGGVYQWENGYSPFELAMRPLPAKLAAILDDILDKRQRAFACKQERALIATPQLEIIADALHYIPNWSAREREGGLDYQQWVSILMAVHSAYPGEDGVAICEAWSSGYDGEIEQKFKSFNSSGITLGTLQHMARANGWPGSFDDLYDGFSANAPEIVLKKLYDAWPYTITDNRMVYQEETKRHGIVDRPIADFVAKVVKEDHLEDGAIVRSIQVTGMRGGEFTLRTIAPDVWGNPVKLANHISGHISTLDRIYPRMSEHLAAAISALSDNIDVRRLYERTGWLGNEFLMPGRQEVRLERLQYSWSNASYSNSALEALINAVDPRQSLPVLAYTLGAPLAKKAGWSKRYACMIVGRTGSLKTSFAKLATNIYADHMIGDDDLQGWGKAGTLVGITKLSIACQDMPFLLDNYKPNTGEGEQGFVDFIQLIIEGRERTRGKRNGQLQHSEAIRTWPLITGEDLPESDAATVARILAVNFAKTEDIAGVRAASQFAQSGELGSIGAVWLEWLESMDSHQIIKEVMADYDSRHERWVSRLKAANPGAQNILRCADNLTMNESSWLIACQHPLLSTVLKKYSNDYYAGIKLCIPLAANRTAQALEAAAWLTTISSLLAKGTITLVRPGEFNQNERDRMVGWKDDNGIYISFSMLKQMVRDLHVQVSQQTLYHQLDEMGYLVKGANRSTITKYFPGERPSNQRVIWLLPETFDVMNEVKQQSEILAEELGL